MPSPRRFEEQVVSLSVKELVWWVGFIIGLAGGFYSLRERIVVLETKQQFLHGDFSVPGEKK